jgi:arginase
MILIQMPIERNTMAKTIRLLYPESVSGGLSTYRLGARLMAAMLPENETQPLVKIDVPALGKTGPTITNGIASEAAVLEGIRKARAALEKEAPERVVTVGGNCIVSLASFDHLHALYPEAGILWIDAHPDVSLPENGYPNAHAMVLAALLGRGAPSLAKELKNPAFGAKDLLYIGLQGLHDYQRKFLDDAGVDYAVQTEAFVSDERILAFLTEHPQVFVHLDIDVLDPAFFHDTYFANPELVGDGSGGGRMTIEELGRILRIVSEKVETPAFTIAEYLPFEAERLANVFESLPLFTDKTKA